MKSALKSLSVLATGLMILAVTGCSSGGDSEKALPEPPPPPGQVDTTPREPEPTIKFLYVVADIYDQANTSQPLKTWAYQYNLSSRRTKSNEKSPVELLRPPVALAPGRLSYGFTVMRENNQFWNLAPDVESFTQLSSFNQTICPLPTSNPSRATGTYLTGIGQEHAGLYVRTPGEDKVCDSDDDLFWAIPLTAQSDTAPQPVPKAVALGQALLDHQFNLQGFIYATAGEPIQILDQHQQPVSQAASVADGPVLLHQPYDADQSVLVIGTKVYLVETSKLREPDFILPTAVLTLSTPEMAANIRFDQNGFYVIDGLHLKAVDYASGTASELFDASSENLTKISFGNPTKRHSQVFTADHVLILGESNTGQHLLAVNKTPAASGAAWSADHVTDEYLATENYLYFSQTMPSGETEIAEALVYQEINGRFEPTTYRHERARWHFYPSNNEYRAFLIHADEYRDGFFIRPQFSIYQPNKPETPEDHLAFSSGNGGFRIAELGYGEGGHLLLTLETDNGGRNLYHIGPKDSLSQLSLGSTLGTGTVICPRIDFDQPSSYCGNLD